MDSIVQIAMPSTFWPGPPAFISAAAPPLLLDPGVLSATAVLAYSTRKLRTAYAGNALIVTTSAAGNATQSIGFSGNDLDNTSLASFIGSNNGFVGTYLDQTPSGVNATIATVSNQPYVVIAGTPVQVNGKTCVRSVNSSGTQNNTGLGFNLGGLAQPLTVAMCIKMDDTTTNIGGAHFTDGTGATRILLGSSAGPSYQMFAGLGSHSSGTLDTSVHSLIARYNNGSAGGLNIDGTGVISASDFGTQAMNAQGYMSSNPGITGNTLNCTYLELIVFSSSISVGDEAIIRASWQSYWGAP